MLPLRRARRADAPERRRDAAVVGRRRRRVAQVALGLLEPAQRLERARGAEVRLGVARVRLGRVLEGEVRVAGPEGRGGVAAGQAGLGEVQAQLRLQQQGFARRRLQRRLRRVVFVPAQNLARDEDLARAAGDLVERAERREVALARQGRVARLQGRVGPLLRGPGGRDGALDGVRRLQHRAHAAERVRGAHRLRVGLRFLRFARPGRLVGRRVREQRRRLLEAEARAGVEEGPVRDPVRRLVLGHRGLVRRRGRGRLVVGCHRALPFFIRLPSCGAMRSEQPGLRGGLSTPAKHSDASSDAAAGWRV